MNPFFPLQRTFEIGDAEKHIITVYYTIFGRQTIWVDGGKRSRPRHFSLWVDGEPHLDPLFPEVTPERILAECSALWAPWFSALALICWLLTGGANATSPKSLLVIAGFAAVWVVPALYLGNRPRLWPSWLVRMVPIFVLSGYNHHGSGSPLLFFCAVHLGAFALLGPWLRRCAASAPAAPEFVRSLKSLESYRHAEPSREEARFPVVERLPRLFGRQ